MLSATGDELDRLDRFATANELECKTHEKVTSKETQSTELKV